MTPLLRKVAAGCAVLLGIGVVVGAGGYLSSSQAATRQSLLSAFDQRAQLAARLTKARTPADYTATYVRSALKNAAIYALMTSRPHATMKHNPPLQRAAHLVITEAMRIFCADIGDPIERRRRPGEQR